MSRTFASFKPPVWCVKVKGRNKEKVFGHTLHQCYVLSIHVLTNTQTHIHLIQQHIETKETTSQPHNKQARETSDPQQLLTWCLLAY